MTIAGGINVRHYHHLKGESVALGIGLTGVVPVVKTSERSAKLYFLICYDIVTGR